MTVHIRPLSPEDSIEALTRLLHRAYAQLAAMDLHFWATHQSPEDTRDRAERGECYVAQDDAGRIVGTVVFYPPEKTNGCDWYDRPGVASFGQFCVAPERQKAGIGRALMDFVEARAREIGAEEIALDTAEPAEHLQAIYVARGYCCVGHTQWDGVNYRSVIMSLALR